MPTLGEIAALLNVPLRGADGSRRIVGAANLLEAGPDDISMLSGDAYLRDFKRTQAAAVVVSKGVRIPQNHKPLVLIVDDADLAMARVLGLLAPPVPRPRQGVDPSASVARTAVVAEGAAIGAHVVIGQCSRIGQRCVIHPGVIISDDVIIGDDCELFPNVVVRERIRIGNRVIIHAGSVLGTDGFGYRWDGKRHVKIPQIGSVEVEDDVEIGSCVCVDRAKTGVTRVGRGTKIDNLVQVAHNVVIGPHCILVGQTGIAGSAVLGTGVVLGGQSAVRDHIKLGDGAVAAARAAIHEDVEPGMTISGTPAVPHRQSLREQAALRRLPELITQVRKLQEEIEQLKRSAGK